MKPATFAYTTERKTDGRTEREIDIPENEESKYWNSFFLNTRMVLYTFKRKEYPMLFAVESGNVALIVPDALEILTRT